MKSFLFPTAMIAVSVFASPSLAQGFAGATVDLSYNNSQDEGYSSTVYGAMASYEFSGFGVQVDLSGVNQYTGSGFAGEGTYSGYGLHAYYNATPEISVGVYSTVYEFLGNSDYTHSGIEAAVSVQGLDLEVYAGENSAPFEFTSFGGEASYEIMNGLDIFGSYDSYKAGSNTFSGQHIGVSYEVLAGLDVAASVGSYSFPLGTQDNIAVSVSYNFDGGSTFGRRDFFTLYPNF